MSYVWLNRNSQDAVHAIAAGYHRADGTPFLGETIGTTTGETPNYHNYYRQVLGRGTWNRVRSVYFEGFNVPASDYEFFAGGANDEPNTMFARDSNHPGSVLINVKAPNNLGTPITPNSQLELPVIFAETEIFPNFDNAGNQVDSSGNIVSDITQPLNADYFFYTVNPANVTVGWLLKYASTYSRNSFDWAKWALWRDYLGALETVDYRVIPNLEGFGLTARFYNSTDFTNEVTDAKRFDPYINFESSAGAPALGLNAAAFSARYEGFVKQGFTEQYTFTKQTSDDVKVWIDDALIIDSGATTGTANLVADQFHKIRADWINAAAEGEFILKWNSANTPLQIIKTEAYYPAVEQRPRYEAHVAVSSPATPDFVVPLLMQICNSTVQKTGGKYVFECFEQKQASITLTEDDIIREDESGLVAKWEQMSADIQANQNYDVYELSAGDIDDRYLQPFPVAVSYYRDPENVPENPLVNHINLQAQNVYTVNMSRWQAFKILKILMARDTLKDLKFSEIVTRLDKTYPLQGGDIFNFDFPAAGIDNQTFLITETTDDPPEEAKDRRFVIQKWFSEAEFQQAVELDS